MLNRKIYIFTILLSIVSVSILSATCRASVNNNRPANILGGTYTPCNINGCHPTAGGAAGVPATRHHVLDKAVLIERINRAFSGPPRGGDEYRDGVNKIVAILDNSGAPQTVIDDFRDGNGNNCNLLTNRYLTWLTPNLILGPAPMLCSFDPANDFDAWAHQLVADETTKNALEDIFNDGSPNQLAEYFSQLETRSAPYGFSNTQWTFDSTLGQYCLSSSFAGGHCPTTHW
ncbi:MULTISPECIES: hypothetical protein [Cysteiniphilum]|uniref:Uncharacterized protein n=1 Tax=Cysteiniphilum litorale TaxID=2056700 RepID=A0A8J2Z2L9_9GAMM|nr:MULTISPECIES: hypothetical protein [Cysteiniphilum]GGF88909.1 hypothetical protein GCM10010995_02710 [Cysteiniphilum litorale]